jgi:hypothetical protein
VQLIDSVENGREVLGMVMDLYLANMNNRMNNVMKVLTVVSTIFIPLTFIVGSLWNELRQYARTTLALWLLHHYGLYGHAFGRVDDWFTSRRKKWL